MFNRQYSAFVAAVLGTLFLPSLAFAHVTPEAHSHFLTGFLHPVSGLDHLLAMLSVGIVSTQMTQKHAIWILPAAFVSMMTVGGTMGMAGIPVSGIETGIALSVLLLGASIFLGSKWPVIVIYGFVGGFALCHGYAHGAEMSQQAHAVPFVLGFVIATVALHLAGVAIGLSAGRMAPGLRYVSLGGGIIATIGAQFLIASLA